jgi:hypothetical protein
MSARGTWRSGQLLAQNLPRDQLELVEPTGEVPQRQRGGWGSFRFGEVAPGRPSTRCRGQFDGQSPGQGEDPSDPLALVGKPGGVLGRADRLPIRLTVFQLEQQQFFEQWSPLFVRDLAEKLLNARNLVLPQALGEPFHEAVNSVAEGGVQGRSRGGKTQARHRLQCDVATGRKATFGGIATPGCRESSCGRKFVSPADQAASRSRDREGEVTKSCAAATTGRRFPARGAVSRDAVSQYTFRWRDDGMSSALRYLVMVRRARL